MVDKRRCHNITAGHITSRAYCNTFAAAIRLNNNQPNVCETCSAFVEPPTEIDFFIKRNALDKALKEMQDAMDASRNELVANSVKARTLRAEVNGIAKVRMLLTTVKAYEIIPGADA